MTDTFIYDVEPPVDHKREQLTRGFELLGRMAFQEGWPLEEVETRLRSAYAAGALKYHENIKDASEALGIHRNTFSKYLRGK